MQKITVEKEIAGQKLTISTGTIARQAAGSVTVQYGDTVVLAAVARGTPREGMDFFPLQVEYRERRSAAGKFPGGFIKREGRPSDREVLVMRAVDRSLRPLFPDGFKDEVQVHLNVLSFDGKNDPDAIAGIAASACVAVSDLPWDGPVAYVRVGLGEEGVMLMPTVEDMEASDIDLLVAGTADMVNMIEVEAFEVPEEEVMECLEEGHKVVKEICGLISDLKKQAGKEPVWDNKPEVDEDIAKELEKLVAKDLKKIIKDNAGKADRGKLVKELKKEAILKLAPEVGPDATYAQAMGHKARQGTINDYFSKIQKRITRELIVSGTRPDGRGHDDIRPISCEAGIVPMVHGSSLFTRGETQSLCTVTLGTSGDDQIVDGLLPEYSKKFMLHYNFPPYSVGETRRLGGVSRRELGHGALAEKALVAVMPDVEDFPYTVRVISDITESNGSSSMASACAGTLAMMDAGVPLHAPVAGISVGLIREGEGKKAKFHLITDILGEEDGMGDMDFKVCGTDEGITAIQLDCKIDGLPMDSVKDTLERARKGRLHILEIMGEVLAEPRKELSPNAPRLLSIKIDPEKIGKVIGPSGKTIRKIQEETGAKIDIEDDGTVYISSVDGNAAEKARDIVEAMTAQVQVGRIYKGEVVSIKDFGCFVEIAPETDGLVHVSELTSGFIRNVGDHIKVGDEMQVKVTLIDDQGRIKLSRRQALEELGEEDPLEAVAEEKRERSDDDDRGSRRGGGRDRGGRGGDRGGRGSDRVGRGRDDRGDRGSRSSRDDDDRKDDRKPRRDDDEDDRPRSKSRRDEDDDDDRGNRKSSSRSRSRDDDDDKGSGDDKPRRRRRSSSRSDD